MVIPHWDMPRFYRNGEPLEVDLQDVPGRNHYHEWNDACRGEGESSTPFAYSGPLTESVLIGTLAATVPGRRLDWDAEKLTLGDENLDRLLGRSYRKGWELSGV